LTAAILPESKNARADLDYTIRVSPPLIITSDEIYSALELLDATLSHPERRNALPAPAIDRKT